ncbi:MAG: tRNA adenosine(34) deaminase TadA [Proteobacteria bacterium]|nr:tRNA adenosine(34) deaminase TadA [Pseudomonadota bacterium]
MLNQEEVCGDEHHEHWMKEAINQAEQAKLQGEVPVGAILVKDNKIIGKGYNQVISNSDATAHAEIQAIRNAGQAIDNYRIINSQLYITLEPCMMCVGAIIHARISKIVFGAYDPKTGMAGTQDNCFAKPYHNHFVGIQGGILEVECANLLKEFFRWKRSGKI